MLEHDLPLLPSQKGLWLDQHVEGVPSQNTALCLAIEGDCRLTVLQSALDDLLARHDNLRISFRFDGEHARQVVATHLTMPLALVDLAQEPESLADRLRDSQRQALSLAGPLVRATVFALAPRRHVLLLVIHHLVVDGQSLSVLQEDLCSFYGARADGQPAEPDRLMYAEYVASSTAGVDTEAAAGYWRRQLADLPSPTALPLMRRRTVGGSRQADAVRLELDAAARACLLALAERSSATPFMVYATLVATLTRRHTGNDDLIFGLPLSLRDDRATRERLTGLFINTLPLRLRFTESTSFKGAIDQVRGRVLRAIMHAALPLPDLLGELSRPRRDRSPLFDICINHTRIADSIAEAGGCCFKVLPLAASTAAFGLHMMLIEDGERLQFCAEFDTAVLTLEHATDLLAQMRQLLLSAAAQEDVPVGELGMSPAQASAVDVPHSDATPFVHARLRAHAEDLTQRDAVVDSSERLTYAQLDTVADRLCASLKSAGIGPGAVVALCLPLSTRAIAALLAVWRLGATCVPLDPRRSDDLLRAALRDASVTALLGTSTLVGRFSEVVPQALAIEAALAATDLMSDVTDMTERPVADAAALLFMDARAGGAARVIVQTHRDLAALMDREETVSGDALVVATMENGHALASLLRALQAGVTVVLADQILDAGAPDFSALASNAPSRIVCSTATFVNLVASGQLHGFRHAELSEAPLSLALVALAAARGVAVREAYPGTGCAGIELMRAAPSSPEQAHFWRADGPTPLRLAVLDRHGQPMPAGVIGRIHVLGAGAGQAWRAETGIPLMRSFDRLATCQTEDLGRYLADGAIERLSGAPDPHTPEGLRFDALAIEQGLMQLDDLAHAVVAWRRVPNVGHRLVAWVTGIAGIAPAATRVLERLRAATSADVACVLLSRWPLKPDGRIDRDALPDTSETTKAEAPSPARPVEVPSSALTTPTQRRLAPIWQAVLKVADVSLDDNFFECRGHSLLAARLAAHASKEFAVNVPLGAIFDAEDFRALAAAIDVLLECPDQEPPPITRRVPVAASS